jgi:regulatory protein
MSGKITALKVQKRNNQRVNVYLEGEFAFGLARITAAWLRLGQELSDEKIAQLLSEDARESAYQRALHLLERRSRSEAEIRRSLARQEIEEDVINNVIQRLARSDLVNDKKFASLWAENRQEFRPRSRKALAFEMRQKGIASDAIDQVLSGISDQDEEELAYQAASKQARKYKNLDWPNFRQKMAGFLARRGFNYETSLSAIQRTWQEASDQDSDQEHDLPSPENKNSLNERQQNEWR